MVKLLYSPASETFAVAAAARPPNSALQNDIEGLLSLCAPARGRCYLRARQCRDVRAAVCCGAIAGVTVPFAALAARMIAGRKTMPKGYWVTCYRSISDPNKLAAYAELAPKATAPFGCRYLARGTASTAFEAGQKERI